VYTSTKFLALHGTGSLLEQAENDFATFRLGTSYLHANNSATFKAKVSFNSMYQ
jgi:hypothetical protein